MKDAFSSEPEVVVEEYIEGREFSVGVDVYKRQIVERGVAHSEGRCHGTEHIWIARANEKLSLIHIYEGGGGADVAPVSVIGKMRHAADLIAGDDSAV